MEANKTFNFFIDEKVTAWYRTGFSLEASNQEEAIEQAIKFVENGNHLAIRWNVIDETVEPMDIQSNEENPTAELFTSNAEDDLIWDNKHGLLLNI